MIKWTKEAHGVEPWTYRTAADCSTTELYLLLVLVSPTRAIEVAPAASAARASVVFFCPVSCDCRTSFLDRAVHEALKNPVRELIVAQCTAIKELEAGGLK